MHEKAFIIFQSNWLKQMDMDNLDDEDNLHFPGLQLEAEHFLVNERKVGGIGHKTSDTDSPLTSKQTNYEVEHYILSQNRIRVELSTNLDQCHQRVRYFLYLPKDNRWKRISCALLCSGTKINKKRLYNI